MLSNFILLTDVPELRFLQYVLNIMCAANMAKLIFIKALDTMH